MKQRPEILLIERLPKAFLVYGNNPSIEDYLSSEFIFSKLNGKRSEIKTFYEQELLSVSKEKIYLETSLFESYQLYIVHDVTDKFLTLIESYDGNVPLMMVGKNLKSSSKLVTYMNQHPLYYSVGIYGDDVNFLNALIKYELKSYGLKDDIGRFILSKLNTFTHVRQQLKLIKQLYPEGSSLTISHMEKCFFPEPDVNVFKVAEVIVSKNVKAMIEVFEKSQGVFEKETIPLIRIVAKQFLDLLNLRRKIDQGQSAHNVVNSAVPMIPFNRRPQVIHNLSKWSISALLKSLIKLDEMEILAKQPHLWSVDLMERYFFQMAKF